MHNILIPVLWLFLFSGIQAENDSLGLDKGAYFEYQDWTCDITGNRAIVKGHSKITILNAMGDQYNHIGIYEQSHSKIKDFQIRLIDSAGSVVSKIGKTELSKNCGFGAEFQLYNDICYYYSEPTLPKYPYSIEHEFTLELSSLFLWRGVTFQQSIPVKLTSYSLCCPENFGFQYKLYGSEDMPNLEVVKGKNIYKWEFRDLKASEKIDYAVDGDPELISLSFVADKLTLGDYSFDKPSWNNIGQWYKDLSKECYLTEMADDKLVADRDELAAARLIYERIINNFRYVSISIGIGGWKPHRAEDVLKAHYGDCKDLTTALISELGLSGIRAYPCLALTRGNGRLDLDFPNFGFNHVFALAIIDGDTIWMDPVCNQCQFGSLPEADNNIPVLVMVDDSSFIQNTPATYPEDCRTAMKSAIHFDRTGFMVVESSKSYYGNFAQSKRNSLLHLDRDELETEMNDILPGGRKKFELIDYKISNLENRNEPLTIELKAKRRQKIDFFNKTFFIQPGIIETENIFDFIDTLERKTPINLGIPWQKEHYIEIIADSSLNIDSVAIPSNDSVMYDFADISCCYEKLGNRLSIKTVKKSNQYTLPVSDLGNYERFRKKSRELLLNSIKIFIY